MMTRDLTKKQFMKQLEKRGWKCKHSGYVETDKGLNIYRFNAGGRLRTQLSYLINETIAFEQMQAKRKVKT